MEGTEKRQEHVMTQDAGVQVPNPKTRNPMASFNTLVVLVMSCFDDSEESKQNVQSEFRRLPTLEQNSEKETSPWRSLI